MPFKDNIKTFWVIFFGSWWPDNWSKKHVELAYMMEQCKKTLARKMDIVHVLRDIESFDFYMNLRIEKEVV